MTYSDHGGRPRQGSAPSSGSSRSYAQGPRGRVPSQGTYHGPRGTRQRSSAPHRSSGPGYPLRARSINFQSGRARRLSANRRLLILSALALVLLVLLIVGVSSCVRGCSSDQGASGEANPVDARVAAYPDAEKTAQPYGEDATVGTVPELYCWDARWGNVDYAGAPLALTGSGPASLSMAYMALTGNADRTPADFAQAVTDAEMATGDSCMSGSFLDGSGTLDGTGLTCSTYTSNADNLTQVLDKGTYILLEAQAGMLTDSTHWVIVVTENSDGSVQVYDPTSPEVSSRPWDPATIASAGETLYALSASDSGDE